MFPRFLQPTWAACKLSVSTAPSATTVAVRRLLQAYTQAHRAPTSEHGRRIILEAVDEIQAMPDLKHIDFSKVRSLSEATAAESGSSAR